VNTTVVKGGTSDLILKISDAFLTLKGLENFYSLSPRIFCRPESIFFGHSVTKKAYSSWQILQVLVRVSRPMLFFPTAQYIYTEVLKTRSIIQ
jgi:hypothetical protein